MVTFCFERLGIPFSNYGTLPGVWHFIFWVRAAWYNYKVLFNVWELSGIPFSKYMTVLSCMVFRSLSSYYNAANSLVFGLRNLTVCSKLFDIPFWDWSTRCLIFPSDTVLGAVWYSLLRLFYEMFNNSSETVLGAVWCSLLRLFYEIFDIPFWDCSTGLFCCCIFPFETVLGDVWCFLLRLFYALFDISFWDCSTI